MHITFASSMQSLVRNNRFRRDARSLEEEEEIWFDQDEDYEEPDSMPPMTDMLRTKIDTDFDQINRYLERNRSPGSKSLFNITKCKRLLRPPWKGFHNES